MSKEHIIWSDTCFNDNETMKRWATDVREMLIEDGEDKTELSDEKIHERIEDDNYMYLDENRADLNSIQIPDSIICIGDLGLWNGRVLGYREFSDSIGDCLQAQSSCTSVYAKWYVDEYGDFRGEECHHDGTNRYLYRMWKPTTSEIQRKNLKDKIYSGELTKQDISRYTVRLGDYIGKIYGWAFKGRKPDIA